MPRSPSVTIVGPHDATGPGDTPSRRRMFVCQPATPAQEAALRQDHPERRSRGAPTAASVTPENVAGAARLLQQGRADGGASKRHRARDAAAAGEPGVPVPHRGRSGAPPRSSRHRRARVDRGLPHQRFRAGVAAVVLPVEQHPGRRAAGRGRAGHAAAIRPCSSGRCAGCSRIRGSRR